MADRTNRRWLYLRGAALTLGLSALLAGCGQEESAPAPQAQAPKTQPQQAPAQPAAQVPGKQFDPRLHAPFADAVLAEPPEGHYPLPQTRTGKSVGKLYETVTRSWDSIKFATGVGKRLLYTATIKTDLGEIKLELWPDTAPNHVRNFVALARAGYYDGLEFDRTVRQPIETSKGAFFECLEAGCPEGTGNPLCGNLGYWMKPELNPKLHHHEGTVGAWHAEEVETAGTKFYISLSKAPFMDGNWTVFGKVTHGLDVARKILTRPVRDDGEIADYRPTEPVALRSVTVEVREAD